MYDTAELETKLLQRGSDLEMARDSVDDIKADVRILQSECMNGVPKHVGDLQQVPLQM